MQLRLLLWGSMIFKHIELTNFMGWAKLSLDLTRYSGVTGILGVVDSDPSHSNGTGKSGLITALAFALYGKHLAKNMDDYIMQGKGADGFKVVVRFSHGGTDYEVIRKKRKGAQQRLQFKNLTTDSLLTTEPESVLKLPLAVWSNTVFSSQGNLAGFVAESPSTRKDILTEIFGMGNYLELEAKAREQAARSSDLVLRLTGERSLLSARLAAMGEDSIPISEMESKLQALGCELNSLNSERDMLKDKLSAGSATLAASSSLVSRLDATLSDISKLGSRELHSFSTYRSRFDSLGSTLRRLEASVARNRSLPSATILRRDRDDLKALSISTAKLQDQRSTLLAEKSDLESKVSVLSYQISDAKAKLAKFEAVSDICPTCGSAISEQHRTEHVTSAVKVVSECNSSIENYADRIRNICINVSNIEGQLATAAAELERLPQVEAKLLQVESAVSDIGTLEAEIATTRAALAELESSHLSEVADIAEARSTLTRQESELRTELASFDTIRAEESSLRKRLSECESSLAAAAVEKDALAMHITQRMARDEERSRLAQDILRVDGDLAVAQDRRAVATELTKAFGPTGIPTLILENCLQELQGYLDQYMGLLSDGRISVKFKTTKISSTSKVTETLDIAVSDINGERDISLYSGGERVRVYLAIRLALAKLMSQKTGSELGTLIIDEISDLDDAGLTAFIQLLKSVDKDFSQIFLVSHLPELKDAFSKALVLSRDIYGNYIEGN